MKPRQSLPSRWFIVDGRAAELEAVRRLPRGTGVLVLAHALTAGERRRLAMRIRRAAVPRNLTVVIEHAGQPVRVHDLRELRAALLRRAPIVLLSPLYPTRSHPDWAPIPPMRAAALARLGGRRLVALGGMDEQRFRRVGRLGFIGWAGISAFRT